MAEPFKFIHASDFHLDRSISGLSELPRHLIETLANASYTAAEKIFDMAIGERVDFVLLAGDLFDSESGSARAAAFLLGQFNRLADKGIQVYWCGGESDHPDRWPGAIELPENVLTFSSSLVEQIDHRRDGKIIARILASGYDAKRRTGEGFSVDDNEIFNIALGHGEFEPISMSGCHIRYWALGGRHKPSQLDKGDSVVVYPGTPQARTAKEFGLHGFALCRVDSGGKIRVQSVEADRVRWKPQKVEINEHVQTDELKNELGERALKILTDTPDQVVLCTWYLMTEGEFNPRIRSRQWKGELLQWLRDEFGQTENGLWSVAVKIEAPKSLPMEWYEEDTLLGEYLRASGRFLSDESLKLNLHEYTPLTVDGSLSPELNVISPMRREEILRRATMVGVEYLGKYKELDEVDDG